MKRMLSILALVGLMFAGSAFGAGTEKLTFTNKMAGGKKVWVPADAKVKSGDKVELTLVNTLPDPHGFQAPGMVDPVVVGPNETKTVTVTAPKAGVYKFNCQLHPAHVGGQITVQ